MPAVMQKIEGVEARRAELAVERDGARQVLEKAKAALIGGEGDAVAVEEARARVGALQEAVETLTADRDRLRGEQAEAGRTARREAKVAHLLELDRRSVDAFEQIEKLRAKVARAARAATPKVMALQDEIRHARIEFFEKARELAPHFVKRMAGDPPREEAEAASRLAGELLDGGGDFTVINSHAIPGGAPTMQHNLMRVGEAKPADLGPVVSALDVAVEQERERRRLGIG